MKLALVLLIVAHTAHGKSNLGFDFIAGGAIEKFEGEDLTQGFSLRTHTILMFGSKNFGSGPLLQADWNFAIAMPDIILGWAFRSGAKTFFELGGGFRFSPLWGAGIAIEVGVGFPFSKKMHVLFLVNYRTGGLQGFQYIPYLGWRF